MAALLNVTIPSAAEASEFNAVFLISFFFLVGSSSFINNFSTVRYLNELVRIASASSFLDKQKGTFCLNIYNNLAQTNKTKLSVKSLTTYLNCDTSKRLYTHPATAKDDVINLLP